MTNEKWSAEKLATALLTSMDTAERVRLTTEAADSQDTVTEALRFLGEALGRVSAVVDAVKMLQPGMVERLLHSMALVEGLPHELRPVEVHVTSADRSRAARMVLGQLTGDQELLLDAFEEARSDQAGASVSGRLLEVTLSMTADLAEAHVFHAGTPAAAIAALQQHVAGLAVDDTP